MHKPELITSRSIRERVSLQDSLYIVDKNCFTAGDLQGSESAFTNYCLFCIVVQAWVTISSKSPVMVLQEHLSLRILVAIVLMVLMLLTKQAMHQVPPPPPPMEEERILEEETMFLVDSNHTDAREL